MPTDPPTSDAGGPFERLGRWCVRHRRGLILFWVGIVILLGTLAPRLDDALTSGGFEVVGSDSHTVPRLVESRFRTEYASGLTVVIRPDDDSRARAAIRQTGREIGVIARRYPQIVRGVDPVQIAPDESIGAIRIGFSRNLDRVIRQVDPLLDELESTASRDTTVLVTGGAAVFRDFDAVNETDLRRAEIVQLPLILIILLIAMGSVLGATIPLLSAAIAITATFGALWLVTRGVDLTIYVRTIVPLVGIGVAVDYSLFMVTRFREERGNGHPVELAAVLTAAQAGRAVFYSGLTVIVALGAMTAVRIPVFSAFALGATAVVAVSVAVALTLVPAVLASLGTRLGVGRPTGPLGDRSARRFERWATIVMRRPGTSLGIGTGVLLALAAPIVTMQLGSSGASALPSTLPSIQAADEISRVAGPGALAPIRIVLEGSQNAPSAGRIDELRATIERDPAVLATTPHRYSDDSRLAVFDVVARFGEDDERSHDLVNRLRVDALAPLESAGITALVGGAPAQNADFIDVVGERLPLVIALVMLLTFVVLVALFRSLVLPLKAVVLTLLSVMASYGVLVAIFQWGWLSGLLGFEPLGHVTAWVPPFLFCLLFGLSIDYEVFLVSRIRERIDGVDDQRAAIAWGVGRSGRIITAAAAIMIAVFLTFALTTRLVPIKEAALGLAVAILIDATLVRIVLVPSFMAIAGRWNWWLPAWLERVLPTPPTPHASASPQTNE